MFWRVQIGENERVLLTRKGRFVDILTPGVYWFFTLGQGYEFERHNVRDNTLVSEWADYIAAKRPDLAEQYFTVVETGDTEVAAVYFDGKLSRVVGPGQRVLFWRGVIAITAKIIDVAAEPEVPEAMIAPLMRLGRESRVTVALVDEGKRGLVYLDGRLLRELTPGLYAFWNVVSAPRIEVSELRRQTLEVSGQEILTRDKVAIRVNVTAVFEIVDAVAARSGVTDAREHLYRTVQIVVRQYLGKRTLEEMLAEKTNLDAAVAEEVRKEMAPYGVRVGLIALKDVVLPGDVRDILNQVVTAEKQAQANLIRRREEVAATRSLLNTARLMADNPLLVRLKELEALEKVADKVDKITVLGGLNSLLDRTVTIEPK